MRMLTIRITATPPQKTTIIDNMATRSCSDAPEEQLSSAQKPLEDCNSSDQQEFDFVERPSEDFFCPVTFELLLEPHQTTCCGNHLSRKAVGRLQRDGKPCPVCKEPQLTTMPDKFHGRKVNAVHIRCPHKTSGCEWVGEVRIVNQHMDSCPKRPWKCQYCEFTSTSDVGKDHVVKCTKYPTPCPNKCEIGTVPHCDIEKHRAECPLEPVACEFADVGCNVKVARRDLRHHLEESLQQHLLSATLLNLRLTKAAVAEKDCQLADMDLQLSAKEKVIEKVIAEKDDTLGEKDRQLAEKDQQLAVKDHQLAEKDNIIEKVIAEKDKTVTEKRRQLAEKDRQLAEKDRQLAEKDCKLTEKDCQLIVKDKIIAENDRSVAEKMAKKDNSIAKQDKSITKKENQLAEKDRQLAEKDKVIDEKDKRMAAKDAVISEKDKVIAEKDKQLFKLQTELQNFQRGFMKSTKVALDYFLGVGAHEFTLTNFSEYQKNGKTGDWYSDPFYSHPGGYLLELNVETKEKRDNVKVRLYSVETDHELKWPVTFVVTLQLLNQLGDHTHYSQELEIELLQTSTNQYSAPRDYISFVTLYRRDKGVQYLVEDCLKLRMWIKVK